MAPCVLWMDEVEKGISGGDQDNGVSQRVLGTLLTWMAEREAPVFMVATANAIDRLPPELIRKGRFDELFFVDLPTPEVRAEIFRIHLQRRELEPAQFDLLLLAAASEGFSGRRSSRRWWRHCTPGRRDSRRWIRSCCSGSCREPRRCRC